VLDALFVVGIFIVGVFAVDAFRRWRRDREWKRKPRSPSRWG
jgi:hypothetical protein